MTQAAEVHPAPPASPRSLRSLALRGSAWTVAGFGGSQVLRLAGNLVLTRLLFPEAFGMMSLVWIFLQGLELFSDIGIGPSIIQNRRGDDPNFLNTAWTIQVFRGLAISACAAILAWPVASLWFRKPELAPLMMAAGLTAAIMGLNSTRLFTAARHMDFARLTVLDLASQAINLAVMVAIASVHRTVWALVIGGLIGASAKMILSHVALPRHADRLGWDPSVAKEMFRFGGWILLATMVNFLSAQGDRLLLGRSLGEATLGIYSVAFMLSDTVARLASSLGHRVLFPAFGRIVRSDSSRLAESVARARSRLDLAALPALGLMIGAGSLLVGFLYDERYRTAGAMFQVLSIRAAVGCTIVPGMAALLALGRPQYSAVAAVSKTAWLVIAIPASLAIWGVMGPVWAVGMSDLICLPSIWFGLRRAGLLRPAQEVRSLLLTLAGIAAGVALRTLLSR